MKFEVCPHCGKIDTILKVQIPIVTSGQSLALIYNKQRTFETFHKIDQDLKKSMGKQYKKYFHATIEKAKDIFEIKLKVEAQGQDW